MYAAAIEAEREMLVFYMLCLKNILEFNTHFQECLSDRRILKIMELSKGIINC